MKKLGWFGWITSILTFLALINWGTFAWLGFDIVKFITFNVGWLGKIVYSIIAVLGLIGLINLIIKTYMS